MSVFPTEQAKKYEELKAAQEKVFDLWNQYWWDYSGFDTWQFWLNIVMIVLPLIFLYLFIDRKRLFLLLFLDSIYIYGVLIWMVWQQGPIILAIPIKQFQCFRFISVWIPP